VGQRSPTLWRRSAGPARLRDRHRVVGDGRRAC
jgi:hypothetical protein